MTFDELVKRSRIEGSENTYPGSLLAIDPGHTTGWALFSETHFIECGQIPTPPDNIVQCIQNIDALLKQWDPSEVVFEDYRIYKWRAKHHANSSVHTVKVIGFLQTMCVQLGIPTHKQSASTAKAFCTDDKLKEWGLYQSNMRHANDAIRHACHFIIFGPIAYNKQAKTHSVG